MMIMFLFETNHSIKLGTQKLNLTQKNKNENLNLARLICKQC